MTTPFFRKETKNAQSETREGEDSKIEVIKVVPA